MLSKKSLLVRIYFNTSTQKIKNMDESFIVHNDSAILNRLSEFHAKHVQIETRIFTYDLTSNSCKNDVTLSIVNVTMPYVIDDAIKIKLAIK